MTKPKFFISILLSMCAVAGAAPQEPPDRRLPFSALTDVLADPDAAEVPELTDAIKRGGIAFELTESYLGLILSSATKGHRDPDQVAALIMACMRACQECRARAIAPMTKAELKTLLQWHFSPGAILDEARARGVGDIEVNKTTADELRQAGAKDDLIDLLFPDDKMPTQPPEGDYKVIALRHAEGYNATAPEGWLRITVDLAAKSQSEFIFKHNALFARSIQGDDPTVDVNDSSFKKPGPRDTGPELIDYALDRHDQKAGLLSRSKKIETSVDYLPADNEPDHRNAFRIRISNKESSAQKCSFVLSWSIRTTPKTPAAVSRP